MEEMYPSPHDHRMYGDGHHLRVETTIVLGKWMVEHMQARSAADLSCGNAAIAKALPVQYRYLGDYAPGYAHQGPIEETIDEIPKVDMFICSETIEHLDDPRLVLEAIRKKSRSLLLSTPIDAWDDSNPEHLWAWSREDVENLLADAGWTPWMFMSVDSTVNDNAYNYGIWAAK